MNITSLSQSVFSNFGTLLSSRPDLEGMTETIRCLRAEDDIKIIRTSTPVIIDFDEGMSVLAIYADTQPIYFYLDRIVRLKAGVNYALFPLEGSSSAVVIQPGESKADIVGTDTYTDLAENASQFRLKKLLTAFYQETSGNFYFRGEAHSAYELVYVDQGKLHNIINGHDYVVSQQECILIDRNQWHIQYSDLPVKFFTVSFSHTGDRISSVAGRIIPVSGSLKAILSKMLIEQKDSLYSNEYMESLLQLFLIELIREPDIRSASPKLLATAYSENILVDKALKIISENVSEKIVLPDLADKLHISVPYLYKLFDEHLRIPPGRYILKIRLEESKVLLRDGKLTIGEIAKQCGFSSIQQYSRRFRQTFSMTPSEYMKSLR